MATSNSFCNLCQKYHLNYSKPTRVLPPRQGGHVLRARGVSQSVEPLHLKGDRQPAAASKWMDNKLQAPTSTHFNQNNLNHAYHQKSRSWKPMEINIKSLHLRVCPSPISDKQSILNTQILHHTSPIDPLLQRYASDYLLTTTQRDPFALLW